MEDESGVESSSTDNAPLTFAEYADEMCVYYMSIGVPCEQFWRGDYTQLQYYYKAFEIIRERDNYNAWLQGAYIYDALCAVSPVLHSFAKKGAKPLPYHKTPYGVKEPSKKEAAAETGAAQFEAFAMLFNQKNMKQIGGGEPNGASGDNRPTST